MNYGPCMCGATDCRSCGPAQGYRVVRVWSAARRRYVWMNPDDDEDASDDRDNFTEPDFDLRDEAAEFGGIELTRG